MELGQRIGGLGERIVFTPTFERLISRQSARCWLGAYGLRWFFSSRPHASPSFWLTMLPSSHSFRERGVRFAAVSLPLDVLYYLVSGIGIAFRVDCSSGGRRADARRSGRGIYRDGRETLAARSGERAGRSPAASVVADAAVADHATVDHSPDPIDLPVLPGQASAQDPPGDSLQSLQ